jgi:hypothetical protein
LKVSECQLGISLVASRWAEPLACTQRLVTGEATLCQRDHSVEYLQRDRMTHNTPLLLLNKLIASKRIDSQCKDFIAGLQL